jgi:hypothetical protein
MKSSPLKHEYDKLEERHEMYFDEINKMKKEFSHFI